MVVDPLLTVQRDVMYYGISGPHDGDTLFQPAPEGLQEVGVCPAAVVAGGAHDEGLVHIRVLADEVFQYVIGELYLTLSPADFTAGVIYQNAEVPNAQIIHLLQFVAKPVQLRFPSVFCPVNRVGRMDSPDEANVVLAGIFNQLCQFCRSGGRVGQVAAFAVMVGIILRGVDVGVEFVTPHETEYGAACLKAPGRTVIALYHAAPGQIRPVYQYAHGQFAQTCHLSQRFIRKDIVVRQRGIRHVVEHLNDGLPGVIHSCIIIRVNRQFARGDVYGVPFRNIRQTLPHGGFIPGAAQDDLHFLHPCGDGAGAVQLRLGIDDDGF